MELNLIFNGSNIDAKKVSIHIMLAVDNGAPVLAID